MNPIIAGLAGLTLLVALIFGIQHWENSNREDGIAAANALHNAEVVREGERQRAIEKERSRKQQEAQLENQKQIDKANRDRTRALIERDKLRTIIDAERNSRPPSSDPSVVAARKATDTYSNLFSQCSTAIGVLAESADRSRNAGDLCVSSYDALEPAAKMLREDLKDYVNRGVNKENQK